MKLLESLKFIILFNCLSHIRLPESSVGMICSDFLLSQERSQKTIFILNKIRKLVIFHHFAPWSFDQKFLLLCNLFFVLFDQKLDNEFILFHMSFVRIVRHCSHFCLQNRILPPKLILTKIGISTNMTKFVAQLARIKPHLNPVSGFPQIPSRTIEDEQI